MLKQMVSDARQAQFVMQAKMERIMKAMYTAYMNTGGGSLAFPESTKMMTEKAVHSISGLGSSFFDVCGFLQLESPIARTKSSKTLPSDVHSLISPPVSSSGPNEAYHFDSVASSIIPPFGFSNAPAHIVPPLVELAPTPATMLANAKPTVSASALDDSDGGASSSSSQSKSLKRSLTQADAETSLKLDTSTKDVSYEQFLKRARINADSVTEASRKKFAEGQEAQLDPQAALDLLKKEQIITLQRIDSLESTIEAFCDLDELDNLEDLDTI